MSQLKPFTINIEGDYCEVPHDSRLYKLYDDSENIKDEEKLTDIEVMVICYQALCNIKRKMHLLMTKEETQTHMRKYERYNFGITTGKEKTKEIAIHIDGVYCEEFDINVDKLNYSLDMLTDGQAIFILVEVICVFRNTLFKTMTREQLAELAYKYDINDFGMKTEEEPFEIE